VVITAHDQLIMICRPTLYGQITAPSPLIAVSEIDRNSWVMRTPRGRAEKLSRCGHCPSIEQPPRADIHSMGDSDLRATFTHVSRQMDQRTLAS
jgi:hypothetical protein